MVRRALHLLMLIASLASLASHAQSSEDWQARSAEIMAHPERVADPTLYTQAQALTSSAAARADVQAIANKAKVAVETAIAEQAPMSGKPPEAGRRFRVFMSQSVPVGTLDAALLTASQFHDVSVVYRGAKRDQPLGEALRPVRERLAALPKGSAVPAVELDPPRFRELDVQVVPTLVAYENGKPLAWARGVTAVDLLEKRLADGERGDLGKWGPTYEVLERDFTEVMKERAAKIDEQSLRERALANFWKSRPFVALATARDSRERIVDPTLVVTADIITPAGAVIAHQGDRINPLKAVPFTQRLIVFNATDPAQVDVVKPYVNFGGHRVTLITTEVDRDAGWEQLKARGEALQGTVTVLTPQIRDRFHLERVPAIVEAVDDHFVVRELAVPPAQEGNNVDSHTPSR